ncbi:NOG1-domain-containing protein [Hymenopellis radicata]|nr:NOG1-domain-containing protein [Hymenopellis radicata]
MSTSGLKAIAPVPTATDFLDIRKTPTVIHKNFKISRIRNFYMRKVKFTQDSFDEKLGAILTDFPMLDDLHPFLSSLMNVLYDKNHYKLALGQLRTARHLIDHVAKDYVRLLKFGDSLYRCKQLKKAALGRPPTHIPSPAIDPNTRTLLICGYPNVGKSSFINKVTRADVDVQPYAFTTKSLFVGHLDYKYLRWQEMNTIEMQSITALAHLKSAVLYFMDLSEQCGYTVEAQCKLFHSIKPLFNGKPTLLVINKIGVMRLEDIHPDSRVLVQEIIDSEDVTSCYSEEGVMELKNKACEALLAHRVDAKIKSSKINSIINRIHVAQPKPRDDVVRAPFIPDAVKDKKKYDKNDPERRRGWSWCPSWKEDIIPEIMDGKNIADIIDPDIAEKLEALEREEEKLQAEGFYDSDEDIVSLAHKIHSQSIKKGKKNQSRMPRAATLRTLSDLTDGMTKAGLDPSRIQERAEMLAKVAGAKRKRVEGQEEMDTAWMLMGGGTHASAHQCQFRRGVAASRRAPTDESSLAGLRDDAVLFFFFAFWRASIRALAKAGEGDRNITTKMPKHLFAGKRKGGKTQRR